MSTRSTPAHWATRRVANKSTTQTVQLTTAYRDVAAQERNLNPPLVMVHGYTGSSLDFQDQMPLLARQRRVVALDNRGHGDTDNLPPYNFSQLSQDLIGFLDALDIAQCDLLGHSMGGVVALDTLLAAPERFRSLILMDTSANPISLASEKIAAQLATMVAERGCQALVTLMRGMPPSAPVSRAIAHLGETEHWRRIELKLQQMDPAAYQSLGQALREHDISDSRLATIACPTTVVVGALDKPFRQPSQHMKNTIPKAHLAVIPEAAHSPQYENPEHWLHQILNHLSQLS